MLEFITLRYFTLLFIFIDKLTAQELEQMCLDAEIKLEYLPPRLITTQLKKFSRVEGMDEEE